MHISEKTFMVKIGSYNIGLRRAKSGIMEILGQDDFDFARGLGFAHACDRALQMLFTRLVGQGRLSECLVSSEEALRVDIFMREMGFARQAALERQKLAGETLRYAEAYCHGVKAGLDRCGIPLEFRLAGYRPEAWQLEDTLTTASLMSYVGLAQTQQDVEKFIIQAFASGVPLEPMRMLFSPWLDLVDGRLVELLKQVHIGQPLFPQDANLKAAVPGFISSNNWAVAGSRSASGAPLQCNDPHLECNRLPAIWYEVVAHTRDDFRIGITIPGLPGLFMGRTRSLSMGFTYGFMDMVDYFIEDVKDGRFRRGEAFEDFDVHEETILRKRKKPVKITVRENHHGVLEADSQTSSLPDGFYLCRAYSNHRGGAAASLEALRRLTLAQTVGEATEALHGFASSFNYVLADRTGNIGYKQTGRLPRRRHSGLFPVEGWDPDCDWHGFVDDAELTNFQNPPEGLIATANDDMDLPNHPKAINLSMGPYRAERIRSLLGGKSRFSVEDMKRIQTDLYSLQAERFMRRLRPFLPDTPASDLLSDWDLRYDRASLGATVFEKVYHALLERVFGEKVFGLELWRAFRETTGLLHIYHHLFDKILLGEDNPVFFGPQGQDSLYREVLARVLGKINAAEVRPWGEVQKFTMKNIFWDGRLPRWLGFDFGPVQPEGGRATVVQCGVIRSHGRLTSFCPSYRYVTDLAADCIHSVLPGGPSDRRFSRHYATEIERWLRGDYKTVCVQEM